MHMQLSKQGNDISGIVDDVQVYLVGCVGVE